MKFIVTNANKAGNELISTGYFMAEDANEKEQLEVVRETIKVAQKGNKHFNANESRVYFYQVQFSLIKQNLKILSEQNGWKIKIVPAKDFQGNMGALKDAVLAKK